MSVVPSTDRGRATRERILDAASELFYRQGVGATGLDQVIASSRTGKGQLYHCFADKRALVHAVVERQMTTVLDAQHSRLAQLSAPSDLRAWAAELVRVLGRARPRVRRPRRAPGRARARALGALSLARPRA